MVLNEKGVSKVKEILVFLGGLIHISLYADSSFWTFKMAGYSSSFAALLVILVSSFLILVFYWLNRKGIAFSSRHSEHFVSGAKKVSRVVVGRFGYGGLAILCLIPYLPFLKEAALLTGQVLGLKYTFPVVLVFNGIRLAILAGLILS